MGDWVRKFLAETCPAGPASPKTNGTGPDRSPLVQSPNADCPTWRNKNVSVLLWFSHTGGTSAMEALSSLLQQVTPPLSRRLLVSVSILDKVTSLRKNPLQEPIFHIFWPNISIPPSLINGGFCLFMRSHSFNLFPALNILLIFWAFL